TLAGSLFFAMIVGQSGENGRDLPDYLETLRQAEHLDDSAIGYAAQRSPTFKAFQQALEQGSRIRPDLDWLLKNSSPAGRIYAAILIGQIDKEAGRHALESLKSDQNNVSYRTGSLVETRTVADLAADLLRGEAILIFQPPSR